MSTNSGGSVLACMPEAVDADTILEDLLSCPSSGEGVHKWLFYVGCWLKEAGLTRAEAEALEAEIEEKMTRGQNPKAQNQNPGEIVSAIRAAYGERTSTTPRWCSPNPIEMARVEKDGPTLLELKDDLSPERISFDAEGYIDVLFPGDPWLCVGKTDSRFETRLRNEWRWHLHRTSLIVPSPMRALKGRTKAGHMSYHSEDNTGPGHYLVVEFDSGTLDSMPARLWHLNSYRELVMVVYSGGKSLHGWFDFRGEPEERVEKFFNVAAKLGCDTKTFGRSQFVRMPGGKRADGKTSDALKLAGIENVPSGLQAVVYWNPKVIRR